MESINHLLTNEKILWKTSHREISLNPLWYLVIIAAIALLNLLIIWSFVMMNLFGIYLFYIIIPVNITLIIPVLCGFIPQRNSLKKCQLTWKDLKKYETKALLTNRRWIQKDLHVINLKKTYKSKEHIEYYRDFALINLSLIKHIKIIERNSFGEFNYLVRLYFSYDKMTPKNASLGIKFYSKIKFHLLLTQLKSVMDLKREEKSKYDIYSYYF